MRYNGKTMKAIQANAYGGPEVLNVVEIDSPKPGKGQVLVDVHAAGLNPFDLKVLSGAYKDNVPLTFPIIFGGDVSGVITELGEGVTELAIGDEVYGTAIVLSGGSGAYAEKAVTVIQKVAVKPRNVSFVEAAALPVAAMTAVEAIADQMKLQAGQTVLIHGGAGGVGHIAIQYAKSVGAHVIATASSRDSEFVKGLGADEVIDYKTQDFSQIVANVDGVLDTIGGEVGEKSYQVLKPKGVLVHLVDQVDEGLAKKHNVVAVRQASKTDSPQLQRLSGLVEAGAFKVHVDRIYPLEEAKAAFDHLQHGHPQGKVVLKVR